MNRKLYRVSDLMFMDVIDTHVAEKQGKQGCSQMVVDHSRDGTEDHVQLGNREKLVSLKEAELLLQKVTSGQATEETSNGELSCTLHEG
ncbi:hypothetical protein FCV25MIE_29594 [Fagus crenata]